MKLNLKNGFWLGFSYAALATIIWSGNFLVARGLHLKAGPLDIAFWRWTITVLVIFPFTLRAILRERRELKRHIVYLAIASILGVSVFNTLLYLAGQTTTTLNLSLISITFPVFTIILTRVFLKEHITAAMTTGIFIIIIGVLLLISKGNVESLLSLTFTVGDLWMLIASLIFAVYSLLVKHRPDEISPLGFLGSTFILGWIFLAPFYFLGKNNLPLTSFDTITIVSFLYIGIFASIVAYFLWNRSVDLLGPSKASMIYYSIPLFSGLLAFIFLDEKVNLVHLISGLLIIFGILVATGKVSKKGKT